MNVLLLRTVPGNVCQQTHYCHAWSWRIVLLFRKGCHGSLTYECSLVCWINTNNWCQCDELPCHWNTFCNIISVELINQCLSVVKVLILLWKFQMYYTWYLCFGGTGFTLNHWLREHEHPLLPEINISKKEKENPKVRMVACTLLDSQPHTSCVSPHAFSCSHCSSLHPWLRFLH